MNKTKRICLGTISAKKKPSTEVNTKLKVTKRVKEKELCEAEAVEIVSNLISNEVVSGLSDNNWKNRLAAVEKFLETIKSLQGSEIPMQAILLVLNLKPGLKDTNFQVAKIRLEILKCLTRFHTFSAAFGDCAVNDVTEKLGDIKNGALAADVLTAMAEATNLNEIAVAVTDFAVTQKSPKVLQESFSWLSNALKEFGFE